MHSKNMPQPFFPVIIIEDDVDLYQSIAALCQSVNLTCTHYACGEHFFEQHDPTVMGVILIDIRLPGISGFKILDHIKTQRLPLHPIVMSGHVTHPLIVKALHKGAENFVSKPFQTSDLLDTLWEGFEKLLAEKQYHSLSLIYARHLSALGHREREVLALVAAGLPSKSIARRLNISKHTIELYRAKLLKRFNHTNLISLVSALLSLKLLSVDLDLLYSSACLPAEG